MFGNYQLFPILLHEDIDTGVLAVDTAKDTLILENTPYIEWGFLLLQILTQTVAND